jgi:hypothetical protein
MPIRPYSANAALQPTLLFTTIPEESHLPSPVIVAKRDAGLQPRMECVPDGTPHGVSMAP